jgi:uncharacterized alpha-E superfamily protein
MLHEEPFDFMRLGMLVERGNQTARLMDVKHHWLTEEARRDVEMPREAAQWVGLLRMCAAYEPFFKRNRSAPTGAGVSKFLMQDPAFPRSLLHCFDRTHNFLQRIDRHTGRRGSGSASTKIAKRMATALKKLKVTDIAGAGLHAELTRIIGDSASLSAQLHGEFFDPAV